MSSRLIRGIRDQLSRETGASRTPRAGGLRFALAFPNTYRVGMSSLGFHAVYRILNDTEGASCERVFLPDPETLEDLRRTGESLLSMETLTPVRDFDVVAFSVSFEMDYPNLLRTLSLSRMDEVAADRGPDQPLVIAGGPAVTFNPEPLAPFVDAFLIGEAEEALPGIVRALTDAPFRDRRALLRLLSSIEGVYVPSLYRPLYREDGALSGMEALDGAPGRVRRRWVRRLDEFASTTAILTPDTEFSGMILTELARGCGRQCRFCAAGYAFLPPRARSAESVIAAVRSSEDALGRARVGLVSASVFDHPSSLPVCAALTDRGREFSISSMRADALTPEIAETLRRGGQETLTIAPEAGSERLRRVLNKVMSDDDVLRAADVAWDAGFRRLKLYYMVGLPTEAPEDIRGIADLTVRVAGGRAWERVTVSASCFVPKPWTPFQWAAMDGEKSLSGKLSVIRCSLGGVKSVEVVGESARDSVAQGVLARGDRRLREALLAAAREGVNWRTAFRRGGVDPSFYATRARDVSEVLPWDHMDLGVRKDYLRREYELAVLGEPTPPCDVGRCARCGVCASSP
ncbi:MAG: radical SAM protein [Armatimonadetes bacterium]|nr:radical SAM protein [Armatimonadota bacterium]